MKVHQRGYLSGKRIRISTSGNLKISGKESNISHPYYSRYNYRSSNTTQLESSVELCNNKALKKQKNQVKINKNWNDYIKSYDYEDYEDYDDNWDYEDHCD